MRDEDIIYPFSYNTITENDLENIKGNISFNREILVIEYLGDLYLYKRKKLGEYVYYEYSFTITYD